MSQPLDAEVYVDGTWWPGAVLGWRHDRSGACEASVRALIGAAAREMWVELAAVRLPEPVPAPAAEPIVARVAEVGPAARLSGSVETVQMSRVELRRMLGDGLPARGVARRRRHASDLTAELPVVRCAEAEGRHRAGVPAGRHRAGDEVPATAARPGVGALAGSVPLAGAGEPLTRPIRLGDVAGRPWSATSPLG
ncbi:hypothetical protein [Blastococcus sp. SYSU D00695]